MFSFFGKFLETSIHSSLKMALTILLQLNRDVARLFSTEGLGDTSSFL